MGKPIPPWGVPLLLAHWRGTWEASGGAKTHPGLPKASPKRIDDPHKCPTTRAQGGPTRAQGNAHKGPMGAHKSPRRAHKGPGGPQGPDPQRSRGAYEGPRSAHKGPREAHKGPREAHNGPGCPQQPTRTHGAHKSPGGPPRGPTGAQGAHKGPAHNGPGGPQCARGARARS